MGPIRRILILSAAGSCLLAPVVLSAADWPMWRCDPARRGSSDEELPEPLHLQWVLELPAPRPAWPAGQEKLSFDRLYEPVLAGKRLFIPSMLRDKVTAHSTETGEEEWRFYAEGPVRLAPVAWEGKLYFVCDDGYLYCLDAATGGLRWKFRGGPSDRKILGQDRLISAWPARGAPVVFDKTVYFGASLWPFEGIFIHALDAETGVVRWTNSGSGTDYIKQQHDSPAFAGVAPQGYFAASEEHLLVAGGRTVPAVLDRRTGKIINFNVSSRDMGSKGGGGYEVTLAKDFFFNRGALYRLADGAFAGTVDAPVFTPNALIGVDGEGIRGFRPLWKDVEAKDRRGKPTKKPEMKVFWTAALEEKPKRIFIRSGSRIYASGDTKRLGGRLLAVDLPRFDRGAGISWSLDLPDEPLNILSGDGKLFVTTDRGRVYCFAGRPRGKTLPASRAVTLIPAGAPWKFVDGESAPPPGWESPDFEDSGWTPGAAPLGSGVGEHATELFQGAGVGSRPVTAYLRRGFTAPAGVDIDELLLKLQLVEAGAAVFLNGEEIARVGLPQGEVTHLTAGESSPTRLRSHDLRLSAKHLRSGANTLAVDFHRTVTSGPDLSFDLELIALDAVPLPRLEFPPDDWTAIAGSILRASGAREGHALVLGLGTGRLAEELVRQSALHAVVVESDPARIAAARSRWDELGIYGDRIAIVTGDFASLDLPPYMAELIASEDPRGVVRRGEDEGSLKRLFSLLRPFSGVLCIAATPREMEALRRRAEAARLDGGVVDSRSGLVLLRRREAPAGSGEWTHQNGDAGNSVASRDLLVKSPLGLLWFGGPSNDELLPRHGHGPIPHVAGGRLVIEGRHLLRAIDIYTGRLLWERTFRELGEFYDYATHEPGANLLGSNYVTLADSVYVLHKRRCLRLDAATGRTLAVFEIPPSRGQTEPPDLGGLIAYKGTLLLAARPLDFTSAEYTEAEIKAVKTEVLKPALAAVKTWKDFTPPRREWGETDQSYLRECLNSFLAKDDIAARIPSDVRKKGKTEDVEADLAAARRSGGGGPLGSEMLLKRQLLHLAYGLPKYEPKTPGKFGSMARAVSKTLWALDRLSGKVQWSHETTHSVRHNAIALGGAMSLGGGLAFLIDSLPSDRASFLKRRGQPIGEAGRLLALDLRTGEPVWSATKGIFGTWLGYSEEHDILIQAGSSGRDRSPDEPGQGITAYRGSTGEVLWESKEKYAGPCILLGPQIITQTTTTPGFALDLFTGKRKKTTHPTSGREIDWQYTRNYGCNTALACPNLLTFRSAAAGFYDLASGGTGNFGGFRAGCTSNLIPAGGVLCAPDYTRSCTCSYQNQSSLGLVHRPDVEIWTFNSQRAESARVTKVGLNFGAPGDRRGPDGTLWLDSPSVGGSSPDIPVQFYLEGGGFVRRHTNEVGGDPLAWVGASAVTGSGEIAVRLVPAPLGTVPNEVRGASALEISGGLASISVPGRRLPAGGENRTSLQRGPGDVELKAVAKAVAGLASPSITVEFWVRTEADFAFVDARGEDRKDPQGFVLDRRALRARYWVDAGSGGASPGAPRGRDALIELKEKVTDNRWVHVSFTYDAASGEGRIYQDGVVAGSHQGPPGFPLYWNRAPSELVVGRGASSATFIDELRIAREALKPSEFLLSKASAVDSSRLAGHWRMESLLPPSGPPGTAADHIYSIRLVFAEIEGLKPGERVFDVYLQGRECLSGFDIAREAGGAACTIVREFRDVPVIDHLRIGLRARSGKPPLLSGVQAIERTRGF